MPNQKKSSIQTQNCFHCPSLIEVKYVRSSHDYSSKNNWGYWTEKTENDHFYLCDNCLVKLYKNCKWEFQKLIPNKEKQTLLRQYIFNGTIKGEVKMEFIPEKVSKKKKNG